MRPAISVRQLCATTKVQPTESPTGWYRFVFHRRAAVRVVGYPGDQSYHPEHMTAFCVPDSFQFLLKDFDLIKRYFSIFQSDRLFRLVTVSEVGIFQNLFFNTRDGFLRLKQVLN